MTSAVTDEELVAFLHGELDEQGAAAVEAALNADPALADRAELLDRQDEMLRRAFEPILSAPIPAAMTDAIKPKTESARVVSLADARAARAQRSWSWPQWGAMAASLAIGIVMGPALIGGSGSDDALILANAEGPAVSPVLANMLDTAPSGNAVTLAGLGEAQVDLTFRNIDGAVCRQVSLAGKLSASDLVACRSDAGWQVAALGTRAAVGDQMRTASGEASPAVLAAIDAMIDSDPLVGEDERDALKR